VTTTGGRRTASSPASGRSRPAAARLNIQIAEPVDHRTGRRYGRVVGERYQAQASYLFSDFANAVDTLTWENVFATPSTAGATFATWDRSVSVFGRRALWPDNRYHNASLSLAAELPAKSRLSATLAYGQLEQNETLLPYSFNSDVLATPTLPRATAEGRIQTKQLLVDCLVSPPPGSTCGRGPATPAWTTGPPRRAGST
jgi:hypothetical protein